MEKYIQEFRIPKAFISDNGQQFTAKEWRDHWNAKNVELRYTSVCHPTPNPAERVMQGIADSVRLNSRENHRRWPLLIKDIELRLNSVEHRTTRVIPMVLQQKLIPARSGPRKLLEVSEKDYEEALDLVRKSMQQAVQYRRENANKRRFGSLKLEPGEVVYIRNYTKSDKEQGIAKKLNPVFKGPCVVLKSLSPSSYLVLNPDNNRRERQHISNLKY